jgi:hypothetical protein
MNEKNFKAENTLKMSLDFFDISDYIEPLTFKSSSSPKEETLAVYLNRRLPKYTVVGICIVDSLQEHEQKYGTITHEDFELKVTRATERSDSGSGSSNSNSVSWRSPLYLDDFLEEGLDDEESVNEGNDEFSYVNYSNDSSLNRLIRRIMKTKYNSKTSNVRKVFFIRTSLNLNMKSVREHMFEIEIALTTMPRDKRRLIVQQFKLMLFNDNEWKKKNKNEKKEEIDGEDQEELTENYKEEEEEENYEMRRTNDENDWLENANRDLLESK